MMFKKLIFLLSLSQTLNSVKILGIFEICSSSHYILSSKLVRILTEGGHNVTMVSPYPMKNPPENYRDIVLDGFADDFKQILKAMKLFKPDTRNFAKRFLDGVNFLTDHAIKTLNHPKMIELAKSGEQFDLIIIEQFHNDALKVYGHIFNAPIILFSSMGPNNYIKNSIGTEIPTSYVPNFYLPLQEDGELTFVQRCHNLILNIVQDILEYFYSLPKLQAALNERYPDAPPLSEMYKNVSLMFFNSDLSISQAVPMLPTMIEIGGYFIDSPKALPKDLKEWLDNADDGVIYFSMGSNLNSKDMPDEKKKVFLEVLGNLKQRVLWKFEEDFKDLPKNIMIKSWLPQQDILAHPNVKLFITHGGLLSTIEAVHYGIPMLAIPVFGDQPLNARIAKAGGYALILSFNDRNFTVSNLNYLINELITNLKYLENARERSKIHHDRPLSVRDTILYWVDYVVRHKGADHLRVAGHKLPWYQYQMVDVFAFLAAVTIVFISIAKLVMRKLVKKARKVKIN